MKKKIYEHPVSKNRVKVGVGFNWAAFFFGALWYLVKGLYGTGILLFFLAFPTLGLSWIIGAFIANRRYEEHVVAMGYKLVEDEK